MRALVCGVSAVAVASLMNGAPALAQQEAERGADEITCGDMAAMDTALVPGMLYFVAGHREGAGAADAVADDGPAGAQPGMEDATAAQEQRLEGEPGPAVAGTEADPAVDGDDAALEDEDEDAAEREDDDSAEDVDEEVDEDDAADDAAEDDAAEGEVRDAQGDAQGDEQAGDGDAMEGVAVRGHFEIPIEQTVLACAEDPDALLAEVIEAQRDGGVAGEADDEDG